MIRLVLENVLLFLLPAALYVGYRLLRTDPHDAPAARVLAQAPLFYLFIAGALLVAATRVYYATTSPGGDPTKSYTPPRMGKDGRIEPGQIK